jgi:lipopolysaccharide transport system permease protein
MAERTETEYTPESQLRRPRVLFGTMWRDLAASRELAWRLTVRDIAARYRRSLLGFTWAIFPPIAAGLVFILLQRAAVLDVGETDVPYPVFVLFGTVLWRVFTTSLTAPLKVVAANTALVSKVNFPREALVLSAIGQIVFDMGIKLLILVGVFVVFRVSPSWGMLACPLAMVMLMMLGIALGLLVVPLGLLYTDVAVGLPMVTSLWFFLTPVVYAPFTKWPLSLLSTLNPVSPLLTGARDLATKGALENPLAFGIVAGLTVLLLLASWLLYRLALPVLVERMQA